MSFRLGEYECASCGQRLAAVPPEESRQPTFGQSSSGQRSAAPGRFQNSSGTVLGRDASTYGGGGWTPGQAPPPPAPGSAYSLGGVPPSTLYGTGREDSSPGSSSLAIEKHIYFGIQVVSTLLSLFVMPSMMEQMLSAAGGPAMPGVATAGIASGIIGSIIGLGLIAFVLYGEQIWAKWCCGVVMVLGLLGGIGNLLVMMGNENLSFTMFSSGISGGMLFLVFLPGLLMNLWLLWILWRDIQEQQGSY
jgi:hypothetical protein